MPVPSVQNPGLPFCLQIFGGMVPGRLVKIQGMAAAGVERFDVMLMCGTSKTADVGLHLWLRFQDMQLILNNVIGGSQPGDPQQVGLPMQLGHPFELVILCDPQGFNVAVNGLHLIQFAHRMPLQKLSHVAATGQVIIHLITFEVYQSHGPMTHPGLSHTPHAHLHPTLHHSPQQFHHPPQHFHYPLPQIHQPSTHHPQLTPQNHQPPLQHYQPPLQYYSHQQPMQSLQQPLQYHPHQQQQVQNAQLQGKTPQKRETGMFSSYNYRSRRRDRYRRTGGYYQSSRRYSDSESSGGMGSGGDEPSYKSDKRQVPSSSPDTEKGNTQHTKPKKEPDRGNESDSKSDSGGASDYSE